MVGSRGWVLVATLCLLGLLCAPGGRPVPVVLPEHPVDAAVVDAAVVPVAGRVLTASGDAVRGALVSIGPAGCSGCGAPIAVRTGADGAFTAAVREGDHSIACRTREERPCRLPGGTRLRVGGPIAGLRLTVAPMRSAHPR